MAKTSSYAELAALLLPQLPLIGRVSLLRALHLSEQAKYLDLQSELAVAVLRSICMPTERKGIAYIQKYTLRDPGIQGRIWVSNYTCPQPADDGLQDALLRAIDGLNDPSNPATAKVTRPGVVPVEAEWTGYRAGAATDAALPPISERERYDALQKECTSATTTLYFHGGAFYMLDPASHRATAKKLAKLTGGKVYSVRYRLAPQHPFPAALLDALVSYFALLYPPPGAHHEAVQPEHLVLAGDR